MSETVKIKVWVATKYLKSKDTKIIEVDREEWEEMSLADKDEMLQDIMLGMVEWSYSEVGE